jgi:hypothetical protein
VDRKASDSQIDVYVVPEPTRPAMQAVNGDPWLKGTGGSGATSEGRAMRVRLTIRGLMGAVALVALILALGVYFWRSETWKKI